MQRKNNFFCNPHDIETFLKAIELAESINMHYRLIDSIFRRMQTTPDLDLVDACFKELETLGIIKTEKLEWADNDR